MSQGKNCIYSRFPEVVTDDVTNAYSLGYMNSFLIRIKL